MEVGTTTNNLTARLPILNAGDYDLWLMRIEQYVLMTDYYLWEVIKNGNKVLRRTVGTVKQEYEPTTAEEKQDRRNKIKARATLLMALPNKDQLKFHLYQDAKLLMEAIEKRYGWNKELKKLEIQGEVINQEDMNLKLLRSLPSEWKTHALIWRNKVEIETISLDDLHNNLKIYEQEITGSSSTSQNSQNVAFVFNNTNNTNITNKADDTAHRVSTTYSTTHTQGNGVNSICLDNLCDAVICAFLVSQPNSSQLSQEDLKQLHPDDLEEMDLQWEMAMLTIRARRYHALQNRPYSVAEVRKNMVMYLKNQAGYKQSFFKGMNYEEIRPIFEKVWDQTHTFVPMDSEDKEKGTEKKYGGTRKKTLAKKRVGEKQSDQSAKRHKTEYDTEKEELKDYLDIVPGEEFAMDFESLAIKFQIIDWKTHVLAKNFMILDLHMLVKARYMTSSPKGYDLMLWGDLKTLFKPDEEDEVWNNQHEYNLISWRLFDSCGFHILLMKNRIAIHMMTEKKYPLNQEMLSRMLSKRLEVDHESTMAYELLKFIKSRVQK
ncbi:hypothetical protein Tco_1389569 [Tanacetum coccineum]